MENKNIKILIETLVNKNKFLEIILEKTAEQKQLLESTNTNENFWSDFESLVEEKEHYLDKIQKYDDGFEVIYGKVNVELKLNKQLYKEEILQLQDLIKNLTEKSMIIKNAEIKNKVLLDEYLSKERKKIAGYKRSRNVATVYKNNSYQSHVETNLFIDKRK